MPRKPPKKPKSSRGGRGEGSQLSPEVRRRLARAAQDQVHRIGADVSRIAENMVERQTAITAATKAFRKRNKRDPTPEELEHMLEYGLPPEFPKA